MLYHYLITSAPVVLVVRLEHMLDLLLHGGWACWRFPHQAAPVFFACTPH